MATELPASPPRLVVCDDHPLVADAMRRILEPPYAIVGAAATSAELSALLTQVAADLLLLDLSLPDVSGLELLEEVRQRDSHLKILVLTMYQDRVLADACFEAGANGFVPKSADAHEIREAVAEVVAGRRYLSPRVPKTSHDIGLAAAHPALWRLTPRQQRVFLLLGKGFRPSEIAAKLGVSRNDITWHVKHIKCHLGICSMPALVTFAVIVSASRLETDLSGEQKDTRKRGRIESMGGPRPLLRRPAK